MRGNLYHISLTTGVIQRNQRTVAQDELIERCARMLAAALAGDHPIVPGTEPPLMIGATNGGHCMSVWLCRADAPDAPPIVRIGLAPSSADGGDLWRSLHANAPIQLATQNEACPPGPWCAERIDDDESARIEADMWGSLHHFECCLAWAFFERPRIDSH